MLSYVQDFVIKYSQDPSVSTNRGIMTTSRGDLVPEYEKVAYSLGVGDVGGPVKSSFGFHLIKLLNRVGEKIKSQHLLLGVSVEQKDSLFAVSFFPVGARRRQTSSTPTKTPPSRRRARRRRTRTPSTCCASR